MPSSRARLDPEGDDAIACKWRRRYTARPDSRIRKRPEMISAVKTSAVRSSMSGAVLGGDRPLLT
jgi:hypothetical protein